MTADPGAPAESVALERVDAVTRPPARDWPVMAVAVLAVGTSGPLIAAVAGPALGVAFWRNALALLVLVPAVLLTRRAEVRSTSGRELRTAALAGLLLGAHFATWVPSVTLTSVASATALVAAQPVWAAIIARVRGHVVPALAWVGIALSLAGVAIITGIDVTVSREALIGDVLAIIGGALAAGYVTAGASARATMSTTLYTTVAYGTAAAVLLAICVLVRVPLTGYSSRDWLLILALVAGAQLLGHSLFNVVLRTTSPTVMSLAILFEVPTAAVLAAVWLGQVPPAAAVPAAALIVAGLVIVVRAPGIAAARAARRDARRPEADVRSTPTRR